MTLSVPHLHFTAADNIPPCEAPKVAHTRNERSHRSAPILPHSLTLSPSSRLLHISQPAVMQQPWIDLAFVLGSDTRRVKPRVTHRSTEHIERIARPVTVREWVGWRGSAYHRFVRGDTDLDDDRKCIGWLSEMNFVKNNRGVRPDSYLLDRSHIQQ